MQFTYRFKKKIIEETASNNNSDNNSSGDYDEFCFGKKIYLWLFFMFGNHNKTNVKNNVIISAYTKSYK